MVDTSYGAKVWLIADGFYPPHSSGAFPSHEAICVLNPGNREAKLEITLFFEDREKMDGFKAICPAERTNHIRMDQIINNQGVGVPPGVPYAMMVVADTDVVVQYSRMDTTQPAMALMTTMAYPLR